MLEVKNKRFLNYIVLFSLFALGYAYFVQYILKHQPCNLCLVERIPYFATVLLVSLIFIFKKYEKLFMGIIALFFIFGSVVSFYHLGIEQGLFSESLVCDLSNFKKNLTASDLLEELKKKTVSCKDVTFSIFGISLATFNALISAGLSAIIIKKIFNYEQNK
jgi:disulfide bond formation protein DsbB|tara:strand:- start:1234 stop:1719 length:486 start_codon:yes stop_codon:yes gene_type:complete